jgi:anionic cell wall polymer biosynthesis LytR-Cps2A-Psr (LCP) family protein
MPQSTTTFTVRRAILQCCLFLLLALVLQGTTGFALYRSSQPQSSVLGEQSRDMNDVYDERTVHAVRDSALSSAPSLSALSSAAERIESASFASQVASGRRVNIALCGVDSRIGETYVHADANHVLSIDLDSATVEIISIPRDTPVNLGFDPASNLNILANARTRRGMDGYLRAVAGIAGVGEIPFYVEVGFSQALGVIEFLGYKQSQQTLSVLRSRKVHAGGDFQRVHTQAQFIAHALHRNFPRLEGLWGDVLISTGVMFVTTNLSAAQVKGIVATLRERHFLQSAAHGITTRIMPATKMKLQALDFNNATTLDSLQAKVDSLAQNVRRETARDGNQSGQFRRSRVVLSDATVGLADSITQRNAHNASEYAKPLLWAMLNVAKADSVRPREVIRRLQRPFEQRAWLQVPDHNERAALRQWYGDLLSGAYARIGRGDKAAGIQKIVRREVEFFLLQQSGAL